MSDVVSFPPPPPKPELLVGPFSEWRVIVEGRQIPRLTGEKLDDNLTTLTVDRRFSIDVPDAIAPQVAWLVAQALAIGEGYTHLAAEQKGHGFAPTVAMVGEDD